MFRTALIAASAALVAAVAQPALAAPVSTSRAVTYTDLNLDSAAGRSTLDARLRFAAKQVCEIGQGQTTLTETMAAQSCYKKALSSARSDYAARDKAGTLVRLGG